MLLPLSQHIPAAVATEQVIVDGSAQSPFELQVVVCNTDTGPATFQLSLAYAGAVTEAKQYLVYEQSVNAHETFLLPFRVGMNPGDKLRMVASSITLSFNLFAES